MFETGLWTIVVGPQRANCQCLTFADCRQGSYGSWKTWKVLEFRFAIFQDWKVLENGHGSWKVLEILTEIIKLSFQHLCAVYYLYYGFITGF